MATQQQTDYIQGLRKAQGVTGRKIPARLPAWKYPLNAQLRYQADMRAYVSNLKKIVDETLIPELQKIIESLELNLPKILQDSAEYTEQINLDNWVSIAQDTFDAMRRRFDVEGSFPRTEISSVSNIINDFNQNEFTEIVKAGLGIDIFASENFLEDALDGFVQDNVTLITSVKDEYLSDIEELVYRNVRQGNRFEDIVDEIEKTTGKSTKHAEFIARDQTSKLNGDLQKLRQTNIGVDFYIWRDLDDQLVRETHRENNGKKFAWDDPPPETGHPGQDFNCRCYAEPVFDDLLEGEV